MILSHRSQNGHDEVWKLQKKHASVHVGKGELLYIAGGSIKQYSHYGGQYGYFSKN